MTAYSNDKVLLLILDGWGLGAVPKANAIAHAKTPFMEHLKAKYPHNTLVTYGNQVGLPDGQMGNSEVGHLNIGAGRVVFQELLRINNAIKDDTLAENQTLLEAILYAKKNKKAVHLMGLVSDGGVHSHTTHLKALCQILDNHDIQETYIHAFTDGRDTDPKSAITYLGDLEQTLESSNAQIASVIGRYYAMDRDQRWSRIKLAYDLLINGKGAATKNILEALQSAYKEGVTDEFILPILKTDEAGKAVATIQADDVVICFNFRTDRCRQITQALTQRDFEEEGMKKLSLHYLTMTNYDRKFRDVHVIFEKANLQQTLGEVLANAGKSQIRIAETEKYPHVTFFFSGGREAPFEGEKRLLAPSPKVATYDLQPEMSANELTEMILPEIEKQSTDFICLNFANTDMVGHTGVFGAAVRAAETVDACTQKIVQMALSQGYMTLIIADHGNADKMLNPDGSPNTAHTTNLVPIFLVGKNLESYRLKNGKLADIAPTILKIMQLDMPKEMTGDILLEKVATMI